MLRVQRPMAHRRGLLLAIPLSLGCSDLLPGTQIGVENSGGLTWCGALIEVVGDDEGLAGFDATPGQARANITGTFSGVLPEIELPLTATVTSTADVRVARVARYTMEEEGPEGVVEVDACLDHLLIASTWTVTGGDVLSVEADLDIRYSNAHDPVLDDLEPPTDTASAYFYTEQWDGTLLPSWSVEDMPIHRLQLANRWKPDVWEVDVSFLGGQPAQDGTDWLDEEIIGVADLVKVVD